MRARHRHSIRLRGEVGEHCRARGGGVHHPHHDGEGEPVKVHAGRRARGGSCAEDRKSGGGNWISGAIRHPGALHKALHVPAGEKIPASKLAKASHSSNPTMRRRAALAKTLKHMHHKG